MSSSADFVIRQGDTLPILAATLTGADGAAANLTGASVRFHMGSRGDGSVKIDRAAAIVSAAAGTVSYPWQLSGADTDTAGYYEGEFEVTFSDGTIMTFPNEGSIVILVDGQIA